MIRSRFFAALIAVLFLTDRPLLPDAEHNSSVRFPYPEKLTYRVEWRLVTAGNATVELSRSSGDGWQINLNVASVGWVNRFYRVIDSYRVSSTHNFCGINSVLDAQEGKRHAISRLTFDNDRHKLHYEDRDLVKNDTTKKELDIAPCTHEITGALATLRSSDLQPGKSITLPVTNGNKLANGEIEAQARESVSINGKSYATVRYEAFLFDNVLYKRKGRLFIWISDDADRIPVQFRLQMGFPIGNIIIQLDKQEKT